MYYVSLGASRTLLLVSVLVLCALPMYGQTANTGAIAGTVSDPSRAMVAHAEIAVKSQATQEERDLITDAEGNFSVPFLSPGNYDLTVRAPRFEPLVLQGVQVRITEVSRLKIQLTIKGAKEQLEVSAKLPLLQTENATLGRVIDQQTIVDLPLVDRNFTEILGLTAGTNTNIVDATQLGAGSQEIRANGSRSGDNNFMLNGVDANSYSSNITEVTPFGGAGIAIPAPDTIQEFKVQTSLYDAQYGRGAGANVNVETRSGTTNLHGNAYYLGRNEILDANNFFANALGVLCTDCGRQFDPVERPLSDQHDNNVSIFSGMRNSSNPGDMDARRRNVSCCDRSLADSDTSRRPMGCPSAGNHRWRSRNVGTGFVVSRCSPFWMEARRRSSSQK
jgi:Carboxypeptidase regulatory-like domain/TonB-dependent Receptor Plug Domain